MSTHHLDDDNLFLRCINAEEIRIRRIANPGEVVGNWEEYKIINTLNDGLKVYDVVISGFLLRELEVDLKKYHMYVNRQGFSYVRIDYGNGMLHRANDFFNWSKYGVVPKITTIWNRCEMNTNTIVIDYEKKEKEFEDMKLQLKEMEFADMKWKLKETEFVDMKLQLKEKDKTLHHLNDALELKAHHLIEKDKCIAKKDEELREKTDRIEKKDRELSEKERCIALKDQELKDCKSQLEKREKELSILISLWERRLGASGSSYGCEEGFIDKDKELYLYKMCLEEKERELKKMSSQLCVEQNRLSNFKFAINPASTNANHGNASMYKEADHTFSSPAMSDREYVSVWRDLEDRGSGIEMEARAGVDIINKEQSIHGKGC